MKGKKVEIDGRVGTICGYRKTDFIVGFNDFKGWTIQDNFDMIGKSFHSYGYVSMYYFTEKAKEIEDRNSHWITIIILLGVAIFSLFCHFYK
jgi:hypothetical protein